MPGSHASLLMLTPPDLAQRIAASGQLAWFAVS
jgi:hypothetical protein